MRSGGQNALVGLIAGQTREPSAACRPFLRFGNISESILWLIARKEKTMRSRMSLWTLILDTSGVTAIEYGLIAALIAVAAVVVMGTVGTNLSGVFSQVASSL
jgi:pilus assembly protein Flp/PilA